jgi:hypothetical protein
VIHTTRRTTVALLGGILASGATAVRADGIPAFARRYRTSCSTCHAAAPKLNVLGEAFRLNGYRFPENDVLLRKEQPVPLGEDPWRDLWPRAIWPGEIPGTAPIAIRLQSDVQIEHTQADGSRVDFRLPNEVYLLAGAALGDKIGAFLETEWSREDGLEVHQAKILFQDVLPFLPPRAVNLWAGLQYLYAFSFADGEIDQAARQSFLWQEFAVADLERRDSASATVTHSTNGFRLAQAQPALELNGLAGRRVLYTVGLAQGATETTTDDNASKDLYYTVRYKLGGLALDGTYNHGGGPVLGGHGQLFDRSLTIEHFGYFGRQPAAGTLQDSHRSLGIAARVLYNASDIGMGYVWGRHADPWGIGTGAMTQRSVFGKAEYFFYPWFMASLKVETMALRLPPQDTLGIGRSRSISATHWMPGLVVLIRQNIRSVAEADLYARDQLSSAAGRARPPLLWLRLDIAF